VISTYTEMVFFLFPGVFVSGVCVCVCVCARAVLLMFCPFYVPIGVVLLILCVL